MPDPPIARITEVSQSHVTTHQSALAWRATASIPLAVVWIPTGWATAPAQKDLWAHLLSEDTRRHLEGALNRDGTQWPRRVDHAAAERFALHAAFHELFRILPPTPYPLPPELYLTHTPLGQPLARWRGQLASWARSQGLSNRDVHVSFTHDGEAHITLTAHAPGLLGVGVDAVHLPRLRRHIAQEGYFLRFARQFMSARELAQFEEAARNEQPEAVMLRAASHFSLMEAASKALGTGLKIGIGMGKPTSLPKQSINLNRSLPAVEFDLGPEAAARCVHLGASRLEGHWAADAEYLVSAVLLWK
jgi:phosphopantetheinyl transferase (holo-ACP synthase)